MDDNKTKKFDLEDTLKDIGEEIGKDAKDILGKHKDTIEELGKNTFSRLLNYVVDGNRTELNLLLYQKMLLNLSDEEFLAIKKGHIDGIKKIVEIQIKRKELAKDLLVTLGKKAAALLFNKLIFCII